MKNLLFLIMLIAILMINSCDNKQEDQSSIRTGSLKIQEVEHTDALTKSDDELFGDFFNKFKVDSVIQISRTEFPLKNIQKNDGGETIIYINRNDWKFTNFPLIKGLIITKESVSQSKVSMLFAIEDTGVHVNYIFEKKKNKWWLTSIVDESD